MDFTKMSGEALTAALDLDVSAASDAALAAALVPRTEALTALFAVESPTAEQADLAEALTASKGQIEAEQTKRADAIKAASAKFAAAKAAFAAAEEEKEAQYAADAEAEVTASVEGEDEGDESDESDDAADEGDDAADEGDDADEADAEGDAGEAVVTAAAKRAKPTARKTAAAVASRTARPSVKSASPVTITAGANIDGFALGQKLEGMDAVAKAAMATVAAFPKFNLRSGQAVNSQTGGQPQITKHSVAKFAVDFPESLTASGTTGDEYSTVQAAIKEHKERLSVAMSGDSAAALTAAAWCAPSPIVYSWIADYVVDGLLNLPEVSAPRGGLQITTGPRVGGESQGDDNLDDFGWTQTEAQAEARTVKPFEVIECPEFEDHRLDAIGYAFKIPILTQKAFPELVTDALRFADVMYAHKVNARLINDLDALAVDRDFVGYGPSFTDTLEALSLIAVKERRKWNLGENAILEVQVPVWVKEVFRADMSRRNNAPLDDPINDARISAHFSSRRLAVSYLSDYQELVGEDLILPGSFEVLMYPAGAVVKAVEDVVNLSAIYDAASLSVNEYTGVFFEQGIMTAQVGYGISRITIGINTAGEMGALTLVGKGDSSSNGSF